MDAIDKLLLCQGRTIKIEANDNESNKYMEIRFGFIPEDEVLRHVTRFLQAGASLGVTSREKYKRLSFAQSTIKPSQAAGALTEVYMAMGFTVDAVAADYSTHPMKWTPLKEV